jgi:hypothetical protein
MRTGRAIKAATASDDGLQRTVAYFRSVAAGKIATADGRSKTTTVKKSPPIQSEANVL